MPKKAKRKSSKSGVRVRDMKSRKDPKGGYLKYKLTAAQRLK
jgi:hypothetical protein